MLVLSDIEGEYENFIRILHRYKVLDKTFTGLWKKSSCTGR